MELKLHLYSITWNFVDDKALDLQNPISDAKALDFRNPISAAKAQKSWISDRGC